ncbi:MAG: hypothetical protein C0404_13105 [Verrucomicrobia bacterium]|nr:hypothetical protein [Verrucomicrobiota bacterium]
MKDTEPELKRRPLYQRILLPIAGILLIITGIIGMLLPLMPQWPFIILGIPLALSFHHKTEAWGRKHTNRVVDWFIEQGKKILAWFRRKKPQV